MDLSAFYGAFAPACFALLGLWLVAVTLRLEEWQKDSYPRTSGIPMESHCTSPCPA